MECSKLEIYRDSFIFFRRLRLLTFLNTDILLFEEGSLDSLVSLQTLSLDQDVKSPPRYEQYVYMRRFHCEKEFSWLRTVIANRPHLIKPRQIGEIYLFPEEHRQGSTLGEIANGPFDQPWFSMDCNVVYE